MGTRTTLALLLLLSAAAPAAAEDAVRLQLRWLHQFQFAGYYVAVQHGLYAREGLEVELLEGGPDRPQPVDALLAGEVDFAVTGSGVVIEHMAGQPVVAVAAIMQTSPVVWLVHGGSDIYTPHDLVGRRLMSMPGAESAELLVMLRREGIALDRLQRVPTSYRLDDLIERRVDAYDGYVSNEPFRLQQRGVPYRIIAPREYGTNFYGDVLVTHRALAQSDPERVQAFTRASLAGWRYAFEHVDETIELIRRHYAPEASVEQLRFEARELHKLVMPELVAIGHMNPGRWEFIAQNYRALDLASGELDNERFLFAPDTGRTNSMLRWALLGAVLVIAAIAALTLRYARMSRALTREVLLRRQVEQKLRDSNEALETLATTDRLTGLWNRRKFEQLAAIEIGRACRYAHPLALLFVDIDHFKQINDRHGHPVGDGVLIEVARLIRTNLRQSDSAARWGGEEFLLLIPGATTADALRAGDKLRRLIGVHRFDPIGSVSVSIGGSSLQPGDTLMALVARADQALYRAKQAGRNRVEAEPPSTVAAVDHDRAG